VRYLLILVPLLLALPAQAQKMNKCVDAQGKTVYQAAPCPGAVVRAEPKAAKAAEKKVESPAEKAAREKCERIERDIKETKAVLPQLGAEQRDRLEKNVAKAEQDYARTCK
jgi:Domain of unknown function (DUF4124)